MWSSFNHTVASQIMSLKYLSFNILHCKKNYREPCAEQILGTKPTKGYLRTYWKSILGSTKICTTHSPILKITFQTSSIPIWDKGYIFNCFIFQLLSELEVVAFFLNRCRKKNMKGLEFFYNIQIFTRA